MDPLSSQNMIPPHDPLCVPMPMPNYRQALGMYPSECPC